MFANVSTPGRQAATFVAQVCPQAPPGAQVHVDAITGYVLWGVIILFGLGVVICLAAIVAGRIFHVPGAGVAGVIGLAVIFVAVIGYLVLPGILDAMLGTGCI